MKKLILGALCLSFSIGSFAQERPLWMRYAKISPDGNEVAFSYKGDLYKVPTKGGQATQLTTNPAHDMQPIWSPDGKSIAFASNREGGFDVYLIGAQGGVPRRLTKNSASELPITFKNDSTILFSAAIMQDVNDSRFPAFAQVYSVGTKGDRPIQFSSMPMEDIVFHPTEDKILYHDLKGYEDKWRKHHQSSITRDIWLSELGEKPTYTKLTSFRGENRNPVWTSNGKSYFYLSEETGSFNIFKTDLDGSNKKQITDFKEHPVRFLSISNDDLLSFTYDGEIYTLKEGSTPQKLDISIITDQQEPELKHFKFRNGAGEIAVSPNDKEIAFIVRGDVYVSSIEYGTTRQITNTPEQERNVSFSPDGRSLVYASERNGIWNIYETTLDKKDDKEFVYAQSFTEKPLTDSKLASFQPLYSPDGKSVAYLEDRTTRKVIDLKTKKIVTALDGKFNYSYADGDQWFTWSLDSQWLLTNYIGIGGWNSTDVALVKADGSGEITDLTQSGYTDANPKFVQDGKAMLWLSDRAGYRSHGSWGAQMDAYIMFFDREAYDKFILSKEELALYNAENTTKKEKKKEEKLKEKSEKKEKEGDIKPEKVEPLKFDLDHLNDWVIRLTPNSSSVADAYLNNDGDKLYYLTRFEDNYDLWVHDIKENSTKILVKGAGSGQLQADKSGTNLFLLSRGHVKKINIASGAVTAVSMDAEFNYKPRAERKYIFDHIWKQIDDKFYVKDLHGVDWSKYHKEYGKFLPHINNNFDFADMLSEFLGELNASHTGARYRPNGPSRQTAKLGAFYDAAYKGDGLKIQEILPLGPLGGAKSDFKAGSIILKIDGQPILANQDYSELLNGKSDKRVLISYKPDGKGKVKEEWIKPINPGLEGTLLYKRWVKQRQDMTEKLSNGKIGYVHIKGMDSNSFREVYSQLLGRYRNAEAVIIDTRYNGGGWLHDDLVTLLSGKVYQQFVPRGQFIGNDPFNKWTKPSAVLMCEANYSNAHGFPWLYKELGIGKLIGSPVPGTMTAVWWETQIDPTIVFGIPQVAIKDMRGEYLENQELFPDIEVYNTPEAELSGKDQQLESAVKHLLEEINKK
ncbi:S41 family peptidase [Bacteroides propionicifaciens]|uniref:S41 family peptidase n=1 Tax=Bacteroides propionicifaciens TaxID=392838 RepID=UPI00037666C3|nr:S41 family peptidase [Bacteroides propionicifaciens]